MAYERACRLDPLRPGYRCWLKAAASTDSMTLSLSAARYRNYHPTLGRWIERDPEGYVDGMSLYQYCRSNPVGMTDPTGLYSDDDKYAEDEAWFYGFDYEMTPATGVDEEDYIGDEPVAENESGPPGATGETGATGPAETGGGIWSTLAGIYKWSLEMQAMIPVVGTPAQTQLYLWNSGADISADMERGVGFFSAAADAYGRNTPFINLSYLAGESWKKSDTITSGVNFGQPITDQEFWTRNILFFGSEALAIGGAGLASLSARASAGESGALVHLTNSEAAVSIDATRTLVGGTYTGPMANAEATGLGVTLRTGLLPGSYEAAVPIPEAGQAAFAKPVPIGPITAWQRITGQQYTANGIMDLTTGGFTRTGINWGQVQVYGADVAIDAMSVGLTISGSYASERPK